MWKLSLGSNILHIAVEISSKVLLVESIFWENKSRWIEPSYVKFILYIRKINHIRKIWNHSNRKVTEQLLKFFFYWVSYFHYITTKSSISVIRDLVMFSFIDLNQMHLIWLPHPYPKGKLLNMNDSRMMKVSKPHCYY